MDSKMILGISLEEWTEKYPLLNGLIETRESIWINPKYNKSNEAFKKLSLGEEEVREAEKRLKRFAPYIKRVFPETDAQGGIIESPLVEIPEMKRYFGEGVPGRLFIKCDNQLPVSGSIKARGGIYEVLKHAEDLALAAGMLTLKDDYSILDSKSFRDFFSNYSIAVGSTGNLGLSIGIMGARLGFKVTVHMSSDARQWKKELLRSLGVKVIEYSSDYSKAVERGRKLSESEPNSYFVDDENSKDLFLGYAVAALRLKNQLEDLNIAVDDDHPLFVYLPCGVGGGPGGVAFGLKLIYGDNVHCFFAEPTHSPCMLLGCLTGEHERISVQDLGIDNITAADGLAVGRASGFVGRTMEELLSGIYTLEDNRLYKLLSVLADTEGIYLEPSATAGIPGMVKILKSTEGQEYLKKHKLEHRMKNAVHIAWATGGSMVPRDEMEKYYRHGKQLKSSNE